MRNLRQALTIETLDREGVLHQFLYEKALRTGKVSRAYLTDYYRTFCVDYAGNLTSKSSIGTNSKLKS